MTQLRSVVSVVYVCLICMCVFACLYSVNGVLHTLPEWNSDLKYYIKETHYRTKETYFHTKETILTQKRRMYTHYQSNILICRGNIAVYVSRQLLPRSSWQVCAWVGAIAVSGQVGGGW